MGKVRVWDLSKRKEIFPAEENSLNKNTEMEIHKALKAGALNPRIKGRGKKSAILLSLGSAPSRTQEGRVWNLAATATLPHMHCNLLAMNINRIMVFKITSVMTPPFSFVSLICKDQKRKDENRKLTFRWQKRKAIDTIAEMAFWGRVTKSNYLPL